MLVCLVAIIPVVFYRIIYRIASARLACSHGGEEIGFSTVDLLELLLGCFTIAVNVENGGHAIQKACPPFYLFQVVKNVFSPEYRSFVQLIFNPQ